MTDALTDAQRQAYCLQALARHLALNPGLPGVVVSPPHRGQRVRVQISSLRDDLHNIIAWAATLGVETLVVSRGRELDGHGQFCNLHVHGRLTGYLMPGHGYSIGLDVWDGADELKPSTLADGDTIAISDLVTASALGLSLIHI